MICCVTGHGGSSPRILKCGRRTCLNLYQISKRKQELTEFANTEEVVICGKGEGTASHVREAKGTHVCKIEVSELHGSFEKSVSLLSSTSVNWRSEKLSAESSQH